MSQTQRDIEAALGVGHAKRRFPKGSGWIASICVVAALALWWMQGSEDRARVTYITQSATRGELIVTVTATGTIEPTNLVEISSELSGTIVDVFADYNDVVTAGQVLAKLDTVQLDAQMAVQVASHAAAAAQLENARASLLEAQADFDIVKRLDERGVTSQANLTTAEAALSRAQANVASAQANLDLAQAQLEAQEAILSKAMIVSPITGIVLDRAVDAGQIVAASLSAPELFTIAEDLSQMELQVDVAEADIGRISVGDIARFSVDAYDDETFPAQISMVRYASDSTDGLVTYKAILSVENDALLLRPGMTATADITVAQHSDVMLVPNAALRFAPPQVIEVEASDDEGGGGLLGLIMPSRTDTATRAVSNSTLWVLRDGMAVEITVERGDTDGLETIVADGALAVGDQVVIDMVEGQ
ncbi:MAG: efflux RND transporter periplasmic adaptor subunit [Celeribacter marinus]